MNFTKMINETKLNEQSKQIIRQQFINVVQGYGLKIDLMQNDESKSFNNWTNSQTQAQFNLFVAGAILNYPAFAGHCFGVISGEVHDELDEWDDGGYGMANEMLFYINDLYIKHFGVGFMTIVEKQPEPKQNLFTAVN